MKSRHLLLLTAALAGCMGDARESLAPTGVNSQSTAENPAQQLAGTEAAPGESAPAEESTPTNQTTAQFASQNQYLTPEDQQSLSTQQSEPEATPNQAADSPAASDAPSQQQPGQSGFQVRGFRQGDSAFQPSDQTFENSPPASNEPSQTAQPAAGNDPFRNFPPASDPPAAEGRFRTNSEAPTAAPSLPGNMESQPSLTPLNDSRYSTQPLNSDPAPTQPQTDDPAPTQPEPTNPVPADSPFRPRQTQPPLGQVPAVGDSPRLPQPLEPLPQPGDQAAGGVGLQSGSLTTQFHGASVSQAYREPADGDVNVLVRPNPGHRLVVLDAEVIAHAAQADAKSALDEKRRAFAEAMPDYRSELIDFPFPSGKDYAVFDMADFVLTAPDGRKYAPLWPADQHCPYIVTGRSGTITGGSATTGPWYEAYRLHLPNQRSFTGLLEVNRPVSVALVYSVPEDTNLADLQLQVSGNQPIHLTASE